MTGNLVTAMTSETVETPCPAASRFWEVAGGDLWQTVEYLHVASCSRCQAAERAIRSAVGSAVKDSAPAHFVSVATTEPSVAIEVSSSTGSLGWEAEGLELFAKAETGSFAHSLIDVEDRAREGTASSVTGAGLENTVADSVTGVVPGAVVHEADLAQEWAGLSAKLGDYELIDRLGCGGMGIVYRVRDVALGRVVALKIINRFGRADGLTLDRFFRSARLWARLVHPSIVPIFHVGQVDGMPYVVSQLIEGKPLSTIMNSRDRIGVRDAAQLIAEVADAAHFAHERGVIHRDIKPSNIVIGPDCRPVLIDFGLALSLEQDDEAALSISGEVVGTPSFMSPEQAFGWRDAMGPASDIYSLGATLYTLLVGQPPLRGESVIDTVRLLREVEPIPPRRLAPTVPCDLETICLKALAKDPNRRYSTARELADDLRSFLGGRPIRARTPSALERSARWLRRHPAWICMILVTVAFLSLVVYQQAELQVARRGLRSPYAMGLVPQAENGRDVRRVVNRVAEAELRKAVELGEARLRDQPEGRGGSQTLASTYRRLGDLFVNTDRCTEAKWAYERAVKLLRQNLRIEADNALSQKELADVLCNLGEAKCSLGQTHHARELYREAVVVRRRLVADHTDVSAYRDELAQTLDRLNQLSGPP